MAYLRSLADSSEYELERYQGLQQLEAAYDGMILHADHQLGRLFAMLRALDGWDETLLVVTSDHGESFLDQGLYVGHGLLLTEAETRVPLVVRFPGGRFAGARHPGLVESVDIAPTVLAALGVDAGDFVGQGHDLGALLAGGEDPSEHSISFGGGLQGFAVRDARWTLYHALADEAVERAALERLEPDDPERLRGRLPLGARLEPAGAIDAPNQIAEHAEVEARLREAYRAWEFAQYMLIHERGAPELRGELDPRELERLRELGYL
jgi:arylsulfatase A-like enzyme